MTERSTAIVLFTDLVGSTSSGRGLVSLLHQALDTARQRGLSRLERDAVALMSSF